MADEELSTEDILEAFKARRSGAAQGEESHAAVGEPEEAGAPPSLQEAAKALQQDRQAYTNAVMRRILAEAGLQTSGNKADLVERILEAASASGDGTHLEGSVPSAADTLGAAQDREADEGDSPGPEDAEAEEGAEEETVPEEEDPTDGPAPEHATEEPKPSPAPDTEPPVESREADEAPPVQAQGRFQHVRGAPVGQAAGAAVMVLGMVLALALTAGVGGAGAAWSLAGISAVVWALLVVSVGAGLLAVFSIFPLPHPVVERDNSPTGLERQARRLMLLQWVGLSAALVVLSVPVFIGLLASPPGAAIVVTALLLGGLAGAGGAAAAARLDAVTAHCRTADEYHAWRDSETGLEPARVQRVLEALDGLLGELPDSTVHRFLGTDEADEYMEMLRGLREQEE